MAKYLFLFNQTSSHVIKGNLLFEMGVNAENPDGLDRLAYRISWEIKRRIIEMPESTRSNFEKEIRADLAEFFSNDLARKSLTNTLNTFGLLVTDSFVDAVQIQRHGL